MPGHDDDDAAPRNFFHRRQARPQRARACQMGPGRRGLAAPRPPQIRTCPHQGIRLLAWQVRETCAAIRACCGDTVSKLSVFTCFPPPALSMRRPAFLQWIPKAAVPDLRRYYQGAPTPDRASLGLTVSPSGTVRACSFVSSPWRSRCRAGRHRARIGCEAGPSPPTMLHTDVIGPPRFPGKPSRASATFPRPRPVRYASSSRRFRCCPHSHHDEGTGNEHFEAQ